MRSLANPSVWLVLLLSVMAGPVGAQEQSGSKIASPPAPALSFPSAPEVFEALAKRKNPRWRTLYRPPLGHTYPERSTNAFWLGVHLTDLHLAVQARDTQRVSNLCRDLESFGRNLGVYDQMKAGVIAITGYSGKMEWPEARAEVEAMAQKFTDALRAQNDDDLATLVLAGEWVRILQISTAVVDDEAFEDLSIAVCGEGLLPRLCLEVSGLEKGKDGERENVNELTKVFRSLCERWERGESGESSMDDITATREALDVLMKNFTSRKK